MVHYMSHLGLLGPEWDVTPSSLYRLRKFPAGYELYAKQRAAGKATPDHYLFGFDRHGERVIMFDSPYVFVLHGIALVCGKAGSCPCSVCDEGVSQREIGKMLKAIAPGVNVPGVVTFRKNVGARQRAPIGGSQVEPVESGRSELEEVTIKDEVCLCNMHRRFRS